MRRLWLVMALLLSGVAGAPDVAAQQQDRDWADCVQGEDRERLIRGCTAVLNRGNRETAGNRAVAFNNRGWAHQDRRNFDAAMRDYDEAIRLDPRDAHAFFNRGLVHQRRGNFDAALRDYDEAIRLNPRFAAAFIDRGVVHFYRSNLDAALRDYDEAIRLNPRFAIAFNNRGLAHERRGNLGQAAADFREAVGLGHEEARTGLTRVEAALAALQRPPLAAAGPGPAPQPVLPTPQRRLALVIGIDRYTAGMAPLRNAVADAKALRAALREQGFDLIGAEGTTDNLDRAGMEQAFRQFRDRAGQADLVVLGFFGHGVAQGGNLLLPADFPVRD
ncbi:MAG: tetratricopeptide repeat protein, partial [bacterium]